jgi:hypothetical protein
LFVYEDIVLETFDENSYSWENMLWVYQSSQ